MDKELLDLNIDTLEAHAPLMKVFQGRLPLNVDVKKEEL